MVELGRSIVAEYIWRVNMFKAKSGKFDASVMDAGACD